MSTMSDTDSDFQTFTSRNRPQNHSFDPCDSCYTNSTALKTRVTRSVSRSYKTRLSLVLGLLQLILIFPMLASYHIDFCEPDMLCLDQSTGNVITSCIFILLFSSSLLSIIAYKKPCYSVVITTLVFSSRKLRISPPAGWPPRNRISTYLPWI